MHLKGLKLVVLAAAGFRSSQKSIGSQVSRARLSEETQVLKVQQHQPLLALLVLLMQIAVTGRHIFMHLPKVILHQLHGEPKISRPQTNPLTDRAPIGHYDGGGGSTSNE